MSDDTPPPPGEFPEPPDERPEDPNGQQPPPPNPYGAMPMPGAGYAPDAAIRYGWARFLAKPASLLVPMVVVIIGLAVFDFIVQMILNGLFLGTHDCTRTVFGQSYQTQCGPGFFATMFGSALGALILTAVAQIAAAGLITGALRTVDGDQEFSLGDLWKGWDRNEVVIAGLLVGAITFVGTLFLFLPGIIAAFLLQFTMYFVVDQQMSGKDAVMASIRFVLNNLGPVALFSLLAVVVMVIGLILCGIGVFVAAPVALIAQAYTYRQLHGQPVAEAA